MRKKLIVFGLAFVILFSGLVFTGARCGYTELVELNDELRAKIVQDLDERFGMNYFYDGGPIIDFTYFGNFNGAVVIKSWVALYGRVYYFSIWEERVLRIVFRRPYSFPIYVWNEGRLLSLTQAHQERLLTRRDLLRIYEMNKAEYPWIH